MAINLLLPGIILPLFLLLLFVLNYYAFLNFKNIQKYWSKTAPSNWPFIGMLPWLLLNYNRIHDAITELSAQVGGTFEFKGPWYTNMNVLGTTDPANIHYILTKNFSNFPKGPEFSKIFQVFGDGIFNADPKSWEVQRRTTMSLLNHHGFHEFLISTIWNKLENGLVPVIDNFAKLGMVLDLQNLLQRFTFDTTCMLVLGRDPNSIVSDVPEMKAFDDVMEAVFYRHIFPETVWKIQRWLGIGNEKKLSEGSKNIRGFISRSISLKRQEITRVGTDESNKYYGHDLLTSYLTIKSSETYLNPSCHGGSSDGKGNQDRLLVDILFNFMFAGRDTISASLTWLFWLLATNPDEQDMIHKEIEVNLAKCNINFCDLFMGNGAKERISRLIYLHGAICESLRLFPPIAINHKAPHEDDVLPSGHEIRKNTRTVLSYYSMGRMESIWGKDCLEFKPSRWISESTGQIKSEPSFKFTAFGAGPRSCLGKEMSFIQMKMVVASIVHKYQVEVMEGPLVSPSTSVVIGMKCGLNVRFSKRCILLILKLDIHCGCPLYHLKVLEELVT